MRYPAAGAQKRSGGSFLQKSWGYREKRLDCKVGSCFRIGMWRWGEGMGKRRQPGFSGALRRRLLRGQPSSVACGDSFPPRGSRGACRCPAPFCRYTRLIVFPFPPQRLSDGRRRRTRDRAHSVRMRHTPANKGGPDTKTEPGGSVLERTFRRNLAGIRALCGYSPFRRIRTQRYRCVHSSPVARPHFSNILL